MLRSVPSIKECELKFNVTGEVIYGLPLTRDSTTEDRSPSYSTAFYTLSSSTYDTLATISARHEYYDLVLDYHDKQVLLLESGEEAGHFMSPTVAKFYQVGLTKPPPEEVGDNVYDSDDPDDDDDEDDNGDTDDDADDDDNDGSSRYGWQSSASSITTSTDTFTDSNGSPSYSPVSSIEDDIVEAVDGSEFFDANAQADYEVEFDDEGDADDFSDNDNETSSYHPSTDDDYSLDMIESPPAVSQNVEGDENQIVDEDYTTGNAAGSFVAASDDAEIQIISSSHRRSNPETPSSSAYVESVGAVEADEAADSNSHTGVTLRRSTRRRTSRNGDAAAVAALNQQQPAAVEQNHAEQQSSHRYPLRRRGRQ